MPLFQIWGSLVTIVLFAASLKHSQVAIEQSDKTLKQNEAILSATLEELKLAQASLVAGQVIQAATEKALRQQIDLAGSEKDFNAMIQMIESYKKNSDMYSTEINAYKDSPEHAEYVDKCTIAYNYQNYKRQALEQLVEDDFDRLIDRVVSRKVWQFNGAIETNFFNGYSMSQAFDASYNLVHVIVYAPDKASNHLFRMEFDREGNLLSNRQNALQASAIKAQEFAAQHAKTGKWPESSTVTTRTNDDGDKVITINFADGYGPLQALKPDGK